MGESHHLKKAWEAYEKAEEDSLECFEALMAYAARTKPMKDNRFEQIDKAALTTSLLAMKICPTCREDLLPVALLADVWGCRSCKETWLDHRSLTIRGGPMYKVQVQTDDTGKWYGNAVTYPTEEEARAAAESLCQRWTAVRGCRVVPVTPPPVTLEQEKP